MYDRVFSYGCITDNMIFYFMHMNVQIFISTLELLSIPGDHFDNAADESIKSVVHIGWEFHLNALLNITQFCITRDVPAVF